MNRNIGIPVILAGVILVIGAAKGTWKQVFNDLFAGSVNTGASTQSGAPQTGNTSPGPVNNPAYGIIPADPAHGFYGSEYNPMTPNPSQPPVNNQYYPGGQAPVGLPYNPGVGVSGSPVTQVS